MTRTKAALSRKAPKLSPVLKKEEEAKAAPDLLEELPKGNEGDEGFAHPDNPPLDDQEQPQEKKSLKEKVFGKNKGKKAA